MKLTDNYDGSNDPFEGDKTLTWLSLPAGAKVSSAKLTLTPVSASGGVLFQEEIAFSGTEGDWGATKATSNGTTPSVSIDFHKRRTLVSVNQSGLINASLQADMGGVYVQIDQNGAVMSPGGIAFKLKDGSTLPSLTVSKFQLSPTAGSPDISSVVIRTVPTNISVRLGKMGPFWPRNGDLTGPDTSPDFADVLQAFLNNAQVANGFYTIPVTIHSDTIARLQVKLEVEFIQQASIMPDGVSEVVLPFDFSSVPKASPGVLSVDLPPNAQVVPTTTTARIIGAFDDSRVAYGPTGDVSPAGSVTVGPNDSQAEFFSLDAVTAASSVDLLIAPQPPGVVLAVDLRGDLDGKPDTASLLSSPAQVTVPSKPDAQPIWVNIPLAQEVHLQAKDQVPRYWLVVQSLQGQANWSVWQATAGKPVMQHTQDGGLSWRETPAPASASPPAGLFRLRQVPATFQVPIEAQVGVGDQAQRVKLDRFQPLGRVNFDLDVPEFSAGFNTYLSKGVAAGCSAGEHLLNGNLEQWVLVGNNPSDPTSVTEALPGVPLALAVSADDKNAYAALDVGDGGSSLVTIDVACNQFTGQSIDLPSNLGPQSVRLYPDGSKAWVVGSGGLALLDLQKSSVVNSTPASTAFTIVDVVFSADGSTTYMLLTTPSGGNSVLGCLLLTLEQAVVAGTLGGLVHSTVSSSTVQGTPLALAAGRSAVYVLSSAGSSTPGVVTFLDPQTLVSDGQPVSGLGTLALALTPDGSRVLVASGDGTLAIIDAQTKKVVSLPLGVTNPGLGFIAVDPDSKRAYVATSPDVPGITIAVVDLPGRSVMQPLKNLTSGSITALALTPLGDELYFGITSGGSSDALVKYLPIGLRTPADWFITSGRVALGCLPGISNAHIVAGLVGTSAGSGPAALSQVAPITGGCTYEFSFEGLSNDSNAVAEIIWRGQACQGTRTDSVPIPQYVAPTNMSRLQDVKVASTGKQAQLVATSVRLTAPADANAAEVRFTVPDEIAAVAMPSLVGSPQGLVNGDLQAAQQQPGTPDNWTLSPSTATGFLITSVGSQVLLRNTGPNPADLVQTAAVTAGQSFSLNFTGQATAPAAGGNPQIQVRWLDSKGNATGTAVSEDIAPATFNSHLLAGQVPAGASQAEVHISLPTGTSLAVNEITLRQPKTVSVPVSFVAQSPGQLRVSGAQVGYDTSPPAPPPVPAGGLCPPTPPGQQPGQQATGACHCSCCQSQTTMTNSVATATPGGRPMTVGNCPTCGNQVVQGGGVVVAAAQPLRVRVASSGAPPPAVTPATPPPVVTPAPSPPVVTPAARPPTVTPVTPPPPAVTPVTPPPPAVTPPEPPGEVPLTDVTGIGQARAQQLQLAQIKTANDLAAADPTVVSQALQGVSVKSAEVLIENAKKLVTKTG